MTTPAPSPWPTILRYGAQALVGLALVAFVVVVGYTGHLAPATTYTLFLALGGALGASGLWTLASTKPNADAIPHLIIGLGLLASLLILALHGTFTDTETQAAFALLLTGTATTTGYVAGSNTAAISTAYTATVASSSPLSVESGPAPTPMPATPTITDPGATGVAS